MAIPAKAIYNHNNPNPLNKKTTIITINNNKYAVLQHFLPATKKSVNKLTTKWAIQNPEDGAYSIQLKICKTRLRKPHWWPPWPCQRPASNSFRLFVLGLVFFRSFFCWSLCLLLYSCIYRLSPFPFSSSLALNHLFSSPFPSKRTDAPVVNPLARVHTRGTV